MEKNTGVGVSVIVPVYNTEKHLDKCIGSILSQSFHDFLSADWDTVETALHPTFANYCISF